MNNNSTIKPHSHYQQQQCHNCKNITFNQKSFDHLLIVNNNICSSSSESSSNFDLKEYNLTEQDLDELRRALKTIFCYLESKISHDEKRRLVSPYVKQTFVSDDDHSSLPLYTDEHFILNGLLNHNDGPEIQDNQCPSQNLHCSDHLKSSTNFSSPLTLFPNQHHFFSAITSNFTLEKAHQTKISSIEQNYNNKHDDICQPGETASMMVRRRKVQAWERENNLKRPILTTKYCCADQEDQVEELKCHQNSIVRWPSIQLNQRMIQKPITNKCISVEIANGASVFDGIKNNGLFPMVKVLAPYIILRDSPPQHAMDNTLNTKRTAHMNQQREDNRRLTRLKEKRSVTHLFDSTSMKIKKKCQ